MWSSTRDLFLQIVSACNLSLVKCRALPRLRRFCPLYLVRVRLDSGVLLIKKWSQPAIQKFHFRGKRKKADSENSGNLCRTKNENAACFTFSDVWTRWGRSRKSYKCTPPTTLTKGTIPANWFLRFRGKYRCLYLLSHELHSLVWDNFFLHTYQTKRQLDLTAENHTCTYIHTLYTYIIYINLYIIYINLYIIYINTYIIYINTYIIYINIYIICIHSYIIYIHTFIDLDVFHVCHFCHRKAF
jgi:hypothetical protein